MRDWKCTSLRLSLSPLPSSAGGRLMDGGVPEQAMFPSLKSLTPIAPTPPFSHTSSDLWHFQTLIFSIFEKVK